MSQFGYSKTNAPPQRGVVQTIAPTSAKTIPFDYVFQFALTGVRGKKLQDVVEISAEGVFVALSVGYSLVLDERQTPRTFGPAPVVLNTNTAFLRRPFSSLTLGEIIAGMETVGVDLSRGFRLNPNFANQAAADIFLDQLPSESLKQLFEVGSTAAEEVSFLYSLDSGGTGREYQSQPIHNIAGLGIANGDRPFRPFAKPMMFEPRSSIRIQIEELSSPPGTLFIVLQGYKLLGTGRLPG